MADCPHTGTRLLDWLYDELDPPARAQFDMHLHRCVACREAGASLAVIRAAMRAWPEAEPLPALSTRLLRAAAREALGAGVRGGWARLHAWLRRGFRPGSMYPALAAAATLVLVAGVVGTLHLRGARYAEEKHPRPGWATGMGRGARVAESGAPAPEGGARVGAYAAPAEDHAAALSPVSALVQETTERAGSGEAARRSQSRAKDEDRVMDMRDEGAGPGVTRGAARIRQGLVTRSPRAGDPQAGEMPGDALDGQAVPRKKSVAKQSAPAQAAGLAGATWPGAEPKPDTARQRAADREDLQALHGELRQALRSRACARAVSLGGELRQRDQDYYRRHVAGDKAFAGCVRAERKRAGRAVGERADEPAQAAAKE